MNSTLTNGLPPNAEQDALSPLEGAVVRASDGQIWFAGGESYYPGNDSSDIPFNWVLGEINAAGKATIWPCAFIGADGGPVGDNLATNQDALVPGPDGRLYSVAYQAATNGDWHLYTVTLPDQPTMRPAAARSTGVRTHGGKTTVEISCTGQPGTLCAGNLTIDVRGRKVTTSYALQPGFREPYTLSTAAAKAGSVQVSTTQSKHNSILRRQRLGHLPRAMASIHTGRRSIR